MTTYKLDANKAKAADAPANTRISETGAYTGQFTIAKKITANSGTEGVEFTFQADDGSTANWLRIYTIKADGSETFGYGLLMSAMTCMKAREITSETITVEEWDKAAGAKLPVEIENFTSLCNKPIGLLLQKELKDFDKFNMNITGFFEAGTRKTATDILEKRDSTLDKKLAQLKDKDSRTGDNGFSETETPKGTGVAKESFGEDFPDDLPFLFNSCTILDAEGKPTSLWRAKHGKVLSVVRSNQIDF